MSFQVTVKSVVVEAIDIKSFELVTAGDTPLPGFAAGAHIDIQLGPTLVRQYSLCNDPSETERYVVAVKKEAASRGGSRSMHELKVGDLLTVSAPRNNFPLVAGAAHSRLIAGGIGITPILAMARRLAAADCAYDLHYFVRSREHAAFRNLLSAAPFDERVRFHYEQDPAEIDRLLHEILLHRPGGAHLYLCGPRPFMDRAQAAGGPIWPADAIHLEYFTADAEAVDAPRERFQVRLARSGATYEIPADRTIVEVLTEHGIYVETSCEQGVCGTCLTPVLEGVPDHRDMYLTDEEKAAGDRMTLCISRAKTPLLVLDL